jgi:sulfate/thiosulfate transport system substrate-binding protein
MLVARLEKARSPSPHRRPKPATTHTHTHNPRRYKAETGRTVRWRLSFGGSGTQARAVCDGLPGDIAALALPLDIDRIADAGLLPKDWRDRAPNGGIVSESVVGIVTRPGNPAKVKGFADLARPGLAVVTANPKTAGVARWNFLALWQHGVDGGGKGSKLKKGALAGVPAPGDDPAARAFVTAVLRNVPIMPRDAREASDAFYSQDKGDALLNYENEIIATNEAGEVEDPLPYVVPPDNVRVTMPVALVSANLDRFPAHSRTAAKEAADAFLRFLFTPEAQAEFVAAGFRPVGPLPRGVPGRKFPKVRRLVDVDAHLGGWDAVQARFFASGALLDDLQNELSGR